MCLAIPAKIKKIKKDKALVDFGGPLREVSLGLVDNLKVGDYVLVHAGFAIGKVEKEEAQEILKLFKELKESLKE